MARYVLHPGYVHSQTDGQRHFITSTELRLLYRVSRNAVVVVCHHSPAKRIGFRPRPDDINLYPRNDGNYQLPCP